MLCIDLVTIYCHQFDSAQFSWGFEVQICLLRWEEDILIIYLGRSEVVDNRVFPVFHFLN